MPEDPVVQLAAGRSLYHVEDLVELAELVGRLREEKRGVPVKLITP